MGGVKELEASHGVKELQPGCWSKGAGKLGEL